MPGIEFLKEWDPKKHGWPALIVFAIWMGSEVLLPKDQSCTQNVKFMQADHVADRLELHYKDSVNHDLEEQLLEAKGIINDYSHAFKPYKPVLNKKQNGK